MGLPFNVQQPPVGDIIHHRSQSWSPVSRLRRLYVPAVMLAIAVASGAVHAQSSTCAQMVVTARGETSRLEWIARSKARGNWRAQVRRNPGLGDRFANWARAAQAEERCLSGPAGTVCTISGIPCRS